MTGRPLDAVANSRVLRCISPFGSPNAALRILTVVDFHASNEGSPAGTCSRAATLSICLRSFAIASAGRIVGGILSLRLCLVGTDRCPHCEATDEDAQLSD